MKAMQIGVVVLLVAIGFTLANGLRRSDATPAAAATTATAQELTAAEPKPLAAKPRLAVAFLLDPELTHGMFMGERWVSPPTYFFAQDGPRFVVQAKPQNVDSRGTHIDLKGDWSVDTPDMITVAPGKRGEVTIVVSRPGEGRITVATGAGSKVLQVRARRVETAMQVQITQ